MTRAYFPTVENTPRMPIQPIWDVVKLYPDSTNVDHDGLCEFGWYHLHAAAHGRSWIRIGGREWEIAIQDVSRPISDGRRPNSRAMPQAWARIQPRPPAIRSGFRAFVVGRDGRRATDLYKTDAGLGTRTELGISYQIRRLSRRRRHLFQKAKLIAELQPLASEENVRKQAEMGFWPEHDRQRPRGMWRSRFRTIREALRWGPGRAIVAKHVYQGKAIWEKRLPPVPPPPIVSNQPEPKSAASEFWLLVYGEALK
jgi:hypothetical protein